MGRSTGEEAPGRDDALTAPAGPVRWATLVVLAVVSLSYGAYSMAALDYWSLTNDLGAQFHLAKMTAEGAVPLVDFEHGWNTGSWWLSSVLYRLAGGDPTLWAYLQVELLGSTLAAILVAALGLRRHLHPAAMVAMTVSVLAVVHPAHMKYALPVVWAFVLLPSPWLDRPRVGTIVRVAAPLVMFWLHVELAVLLTAGAALYELVGRHDAVIRARVSRAVALLAGLSMGFLTEAAYYQIGYGMGVGELNRQVVFGQAREFPKHFGWPFFGVPTDSTVYMVVALLPSLVLLLFVPIVWRRLSDPTRFLALSALCLMTIAIRRPGPGHSTTVGALVIAALVFAVCDLDADRSAQRPAMAAGRMYGRVGAVVGAVVGAAWAGLAAALGFGSDSLAGPVILVLLVVAAVVVARVVRSPLVWASGGALVVLAGLPLVATVDRVDDLMAEDMPFALADRLAAAINPELERCLDGGDEALIMPTVLPLYDRTGVDNPTPYYLFHYDFGRNRVALESDLTGGRVPVIIASMALPDHPWMRDAIYENYRRCSKVNTEEGRHTVDIWTHRSLGPTEQRLVTVHADGTVTYGDPATVPAPSPSDVQDDGT